MTDYVSSKTMGVAAIRLPSETIFSFEMKVNRFLGSPLSVSSGGLAMDVDRAMTLVKALDGNTEKPKQFMLSSGMNGSALEHSVPEQLFSTLENPAQGISAVKALQIANNQGIPIYTINQTNINTILPQLQVDADVKADIVNAVNAGKEVTVSKANITFNGWTGCGYIIIDLVTGAGAYMISGGLSGGIILGTLLFILTLMFVFLAIVSFAACTPAGAICAAIFGYLALTTAIGGIAAFYGKEKLDEFMDCLSVELGVHFAAHTILGYVKGLAIWVVTIAKLTSGFAFGYRLGGCIDKVFWK